MTKKRNKDKKADKKAASSTTKKSSVAERKKGTAVGAAKSSGIKRVISTKKHAVPVKKVKKLDSTKMSKKVGDERARSSSPTPGPSGLSKTRKDPKSVESEDLGKEHEWITPSRRVIYGRCIIFLSGLDSRATGYDPLVEVI